MRRALTTLPIFLWFALGIGVFAIAGDGTWRATQRSDNAYSHMHMINGSTASAAITAGTPVKIGGTVAEAAAGSNLFTVTTTSGGRLTYNGADTRVFHIQASIAFTSTQSNEIALFYFFRSGTELTNTQKRRKLGTGSDLGSISLDHIVTLSSGQYIEIFCDLAASSSNTITAGDVHVSVIQVSD